MKRIILLLVLLPAVISIASAQPRALGLRLGGDLDMSYQHSIGSHWIEVDFGVAHYKHPVFTGIFDFNIAQDCFDVEGMNFYAGPGFQLGGYHFDGGPHFGVGIAGQIGLEYCFPAKPVNLSLDYRPSWNFVGVMGTWASISLGCRYRF